MASEIRALRRELEAAGYEVEFAHSSGHWKVYKPTVQGRRLMGTIPASTGSVRVRRNTWRDVRKAERMLAGGTA